MRSPYYQGRKSEIGVLRIEKKKKFLVQIVPGNFGGKAAKASVSASELEILRFDQCGAIAQDCSSALLDAVQEKTHTQRFRANAA